ncbi:Pisatin demethylase [Paramyrothecium foliicola]|nr:Pisatin demethylase [Paramyrothecium foliicola]
MQLALLLTLGAVGSVVYLIVLLIRPLLSPLRSIPGPFLARFTDAWYSHKVHQGEFEKVNVALHKKYGPIVRYGPNRYSIDDVDATNIIYGHGKKYSKSEWYSAWESNPENWNLFSDRSNMRHAHNRKFYSSTFSMSSMIQYEPFLNECADLFSQRLRECSQAGTAMDLGHWFQCYAFDAIAYVTYGRRLGFLDKGEDIGNIIESIDQGLVYSSLTGIFPSIHRYVLPALTGIFPSLRAAGILEVIKFTQDQIVETKNSHKTMNMAQGDNKSSPAGNSFLSQFIAKNAEDPGGFTEYHVLNGCAMNMGAGSDTTAISLSSIMYYLLKEPQCMRKLQDEIDDFYQRGDLSKNPSLKQAQQLPYLQAVIKEALRIHPATGLPLERIVPQGGSTIAGRFFPEGSIVGINTWVQHHNKAIYGEDADIFRPERWLIGDEDQLSLMNRNWMPFGLGSRTCIGKNVSILEMTKLIPRIFHEYRFQLAGPAAAADGLWTTRNSWFVKPQNLLVTVEPRKDNV